MASITDLNANGISNAELLLTIQNGLEAYKDLKTDAKNYPQVDGFDTILAQYDFMVKTLNNKIFTDGKGVKEFTGPEDKLRIACPIMAPLPYNFRKLKTDKETGTADNGSFINSALSITPQVSWKEVDLNYLYDPNIMVPDLMQSLSALPLIEGALADVPQTVAQIEDATTMGVHILAGLQRGLAVDNKNILGIGADTTDLKKKLIALVRRVSSPSFDWRDRVKSFDNKKSIMIVRESLYQKFYGNDGIMFNCNHAQEMLQAGKLFAKDQQGGDNQVDGVIGDVIIKAVSDARWDMTKILVCKTKEEADQFDKIQGYVANADGFCLARAKVGIEQQHLLRQTYILPTYRWGVECLLPQACALLVDGTANASTDIATDFNVLSDFKDRRLDAPFSFTEHATTLGINQTYDNTGSLKAKVSTKS